MNRQSFYIIVMAILSCVLYCLQMFTFALWACFCVAVCNKLALGLDQTLSMPSDSFVIDYLNSVNHYLSTGKPLLSTST